MITIQMINGQPIQVNEKSIVLIAGPYPHDVGPHTYVYGVTPGVLVTAESAPALVGRLGVNPPLAQLTRPNLTPVWVSGSAVSSVRAPIPTEISAPGEVNAVLNIGSLRQSVHEDVPTARQIVNAHGGNV